MLRALTSPAPPWRAIALESVVAVAAAAALTAWGATIRVDPLDPVGQVSALSSMHLAFAALAGLAVALVLWGSRRPAHRPMLAGLACALLAGGASGFVAGAMVAALDGTPLWLGGYAGDIGNITRWAVDLLEGRGLEVTYPPGAVLGLAATSVVTGQAPVYAAATFFLIATAVVGPLGYVAWRFVARPVVALALGVVAALPFVDPYKPIGNSMLPLVVVGVVLLVRMVRAAPAMPVRAVAGRGALLGLAVGLVFLGYTGWFLWLAPVAVIAVLALLPWRTPADRRRTAWTRVGVFLGVCGSVFLAVSAIHLVPLLLAPPLRDDFFYFDTTVDPGYYLMWRTGLSGHPGEWPPPGELGGMGLFQIVLALVMGLGVALWNHLERRGPHAGDHAITAVRDVLLVALGGSAASWVWRHYLSAQVYETQNIALWPRTSLVLTYLGLVVVVAVAAWGARATLARIDRGPAHARRDLGLAAVVTCALLLGVGSSSMADRYMPDEDGSTLGSLAFKAHTTQLPDGSCPPRAPGGECVPMTPQQVEIFGE